MRILPFWIWNWIGQWVELGGHIFMPNSNGDWYTSPEVTRAHAHCSNLKRSISNKVEWSIRTVRGQGERPTIWPWRKGACGPVCINDSDVFAIFSESHKPEDVIISPTLFQMTCHHNTRTFSFHALCARGKPENDDTGRGLQIRKMNHGHHKWRPQGRRGNNPLTISSQILDPYLLWPRGEKW